jgi:hypothetical protein
MIRPRVGDFLYTREELAIMLEDIRIIKELGNIRGYVLGVLNREGRVDVECMKMQVIITRHSLQRYSYFSSLVDEILPLESTLLVRFPFICAHKF